MTVVGEAGDGRIALDIVRRLRPAVMLMDIRMPELDGLRAAEAILGDPELGTAVLMLTTFDTREYVYDALRIGASGFLLKDAPAARLLDAIRVAAAGDALLEPSITRRLIEQFARVAAPHRRGRCSPSRRGAHCARARGAAAHRARPVERRDRRRARARRADREDPRRARPGQARPARPRAGGHPRLRDGTGRAHECLWAMPPRSPGTAPSTRGDRGAGAWSFSSADLFLRCPRRAAVRLRHGRHLGRPPVHQEGLRAVVVPGGRRSSPRCCSARCWAPRSPARSPTASGGASSSCPRAWCSPPARSLRPPLPASAS